jgi:hypothetical protein
MLAYLFCIYRKNILLDFNQNIFSLFHIFEDLFYLNLFFTFNENLK